MARRFKVNKASSARKFRHGVSHTKAANLPRQPMRGGWRL